MSRAVLNAILNEMQIWLNETDREQLCYELLAYFGLIGATNECQALENHGNTHTIRSSVIILRKLD